MNEQGTSHQTPPAGGELPLSFETWASLSARLMNLDQEQRFDILDERKLKVKDWQRCDEHYLRAMATDIAAGRMDRVDTYGQVCAAEMKRRQVSVAAPAVEEAGPPGLATEPAAPAKIGAPLEAPRGAIPSFLQPQQAPTPALASPPEDLAATAGVFALPTALQGAALPFQKSPAPSPFANQSAPMPARPQNEAVGETLPLTATVSLGGALPFGTAGAEPQSAPAFPRMPLQTYASFCAERALFPDRAADVQKKYNIRTDAARVALDQDWQARFDAHPDTKAEWQRLAAEYREWLLRQPAR